ncbi:MAG: M20/M25/M40 family metallo-hydrolase [Bradyrhizobiaceae bacterium]|nr:M20/M25/M40 family metallo-hydrolase [Bradyrhizobiaceae bacterium]
MDFYVEAPLLLEKLVSIPSHSGEEDQTADYIQRWFKQRGVETYRYGNNVVAVHKSSNPKARTLLLNSHHDTVKPGEGWETDPYTPVWKDRVLYGLGCNDAGGALVMMMSTFMYFRKNLDLKHHIMFAATAEEEISGPGGMELLAKTCLIDGSLGVPNPDVAIVGEPTQMKMAVAERGLLVLDCETQGIAAHAAHTSADNAIYAAVDSIRWFQRYNFIERSDTLGYVTMNVTQIQGGTQHNMIPDKCTFVVDVRTTDAYTTEQVIDIIRSNARCKVTPRSTRLRPSFISPLHPLRIAAADMGIRMYGSPTMSDQALLPPGVQSFKMGPGESTRSHTANEFILAEELELGIHKLITLLEEYVI